MGSITKHTTWNYPNSFILENSISSILKLFIIFSTNG